jgi:hypothetical protein
MKCLILSTSVAAVLLTLVSVPETWAAGRPDGTPGTTHMGPSSREFHHAPHHFDYRFPYRPSHWFGYDQFGFRSLYWTTHRWSSEYRCYLYWAPSYRSWFFYEPTYSYYVPASRHSEVYPQYSPPVAAVTPTPPVVQQTTVVVPPTAPVGPVADTALPSVAPVTPVAAAIQNTKVGSGTP